MNKIKYILSIVFVASLLSCGGGDDDPPIPEPPVVLLPSASTLVFPANNEECITGVSMNTTQSKVNFKWNKGANATSYTIVVKNLLTNSELSTNSNLNEVDIIVKKATPYKWWVISKATGVSETAKSLEWKFYNSGDAVQTYAPFPAEIVSPVMGSTISGAAVTLEWTGSDVDNDIKEYDVYFDTANPPTENIGTVTQLLIENVSISSNTYFWKIVTRDEEGNTSTSPLFQFKVE